MEGRTEKSIVNIASALIGQATAVLLGFATRMIFVKQLGDIYAGINGLCTSIVGLLSLAELGVGESINYKLYKPLAENNVEKLKSLMRLYRKIYCTIGAIIMIIGVALLPFLKFFLKASETESVDKLYLIYLLFVANSALSYFYSYKCALITSDQKRYIVNIYHYTFYSLMNIFQILILLKTKNFILYLLIMIACTVGQNIIISLRADRLYPFLKEKNISKLGDADINEIKKNTKALLYHKIGSQVVNSTDNILISKIIGLAVAGIYSNYSLVITAINTIVSQLFSALTASVGNLGATENEEKSEKILHRMLFGNFWFVCIICSAFYSSVQLLVFQMFGGQRVLSNVVLICIVINLYLYNIRRTVWTFRDGYGLFWYDRYKAIVEALINLVVSIILGQKIGLVGILIGTIFSTVATSLWVEPYILYKYAFKKNALNYFLTLGKYTAVTGFMCIICRHVVLLLELSGYLGFIMGCILSVVIVCCVVLLIFHKTDEFFFYKSILVNILSKFVNIKKS